MALPDIPPGETFGENEMLNWFGCTGKNKSPAMTWHGAPAGTKSYLVSMFDVDAPTSSGFRHWSARNIPATAKSLPAGAGTPGDTGLPTPAVLGRSDFGESGYGGACPPPGGPAGPRDGLGLLPVRLYAARPRVRGAGGPSHVGGAGSAEP